MCRRWRLRRLCRLGFGATAVVATETEVIGKFTGMDDDAKRLIALHLKALRAAGAIK